jgi:hypothetical protein
MGFVFVFDLDQTIAGDYSQPPYSPPYDSIQLNEFLIENILKPLNKDDARSRGITDAIVLYTNNGNYQYIKAVEDKISLTYIPGFQFDYIMWRTDPLRAYQLAGAPKVIDDVYTMLEEIRVPTADLPNRIIFFDDQMHFLVDEINRSNYIKIVPPFSKDSSYLDETNYSAVYKIIDMINNKATGLATRIPGNVPTPLSAVGGKRWRLGRTRKYKKKKLRTRRLKRRL